jgi:hypothetical protein
MDEKDLRCPLTELYREQCAHCQGLQTLEEEIKEEEKEWELREIISD